MIDVRRRVTLQQARSFDGARRSCRSASPAGLDGHLTCASRSSAGQPLCLIGDSGTGKSHLLIGLGTAAAEHGHRVRYTTAAALVNELVEAADDRHLSKTIARYGRVDLLCLDELGYLELDQFLDAWLASDHERLEQSLTRFVGHNAYNLNLLREHLHRFAVLLGAETRPLSRPTRRPTPDAFNAPF